MLRLARRLFTLCSAVSLLLCVVVCVLWVRSLFRFDHVCVYYAGVRRVSAFTYPSVLELSWTARGGPPGLTNVEHTSSPSHGPAANWLDFGFEPITTLLPDDGLDDFHSATGHELLLPLWSVAATLSIPPAVTLRSYLRRRRRARRGLCPACGYDLRATPDRCPECGAEAVLGVTGPKKLDI